MDHPAKRPEYGAYRVKNAVWNGAGDNPQQGQTLLRNRVF